MQGGTHRETIDKKIIIYLFGLFFYEDCVTSLLLLKGFKAKRKKFSKEILYRRYDKHFMDVTDSFPALVSLDIG